MATPVIPEGFVLDKPQGASLPQGFVLDDPQQSQQPQQPELTPMQQIFERGRGVIEPALTIGTAMTAEPIAGIAGLVQAANPLAAPGAGERAVASTREALTFQPRSKTGQEGLKILSDFIDFETTGFQENLGILTGGVNILAGGDKESATDVKEFVEQHGLGGSLGELVFEATGSEGLATVAKTSPDIILSALGLSSLRSLKSGTRLLDTAGNPTKQLEHALSKKGLVFENLTPEARAAIPEFSDPKLLPSPKKDALNQAEESLKKQITAGGRDDGLAPFKVNAKGEVIGDKIGAEAIRQGFKPGFVQAVKTANHATKQAMKAMLDMTKRVKGNARLALDFRPTDVVGDVMVKRLTFIRDKANNARENLNIIAQTELKGKPMNTSKVLNQFEKSLGDLDIHLKEGRGGVPVPEYKGSMISKDRTSQRVINDLIDLMAEGVKPDALRFHKLKRQLDTMIDFRKKSATGLTDAGRKVLIDIRKSLNESLRDVNQRYATVNDTMSQSLGAFEDFQKAVGPSIDIFGGRSNASIGQDLRSLMSNNKTRVRLTNAVNQLDDVAANLGGKFSEDVKDLSLFAINLENKFGAIAESGLKAEVGAAVESAVSQGPTRAAANVAAGKLASGAEKLRGINDFNAFKSMEALLNRTN